MHPLTPIPALSRIAIAFLGVLLPIQSTIAQPVPIVQPSSAQPIQLTLEAVIALVLQSNRELKNAALNRIVQQQELRQAESKFNPQLTPSASLGAQQELAVLPNLGGGESRDRTRLDRSLGVESSLRTRIGTNISLSATALDPQLELTIRQPLLRGARPAVNEASVRSARLTDTRNQLELRRTISTKITDAIAAYRTLIRSQEAVKIQVLSLESKRRQLEVLTVLVNAGRRARVDLIDTQTAIAETQRQLVEAQNQLAQANSALLQIIDTDQAFLITAPVATIEQLIRTALLRTQTLSPEQALSTAYLTRSDYLQAKIDIETEKFGLLEAQDETRWQLDATTRVRLNSDSNIRAGLELRQTFGDVARETRVQQRQISVLQNTNTLGQLTDQIRRDVTDKLRDITAGIAQIRAAEQARQFAEQQLQIAQERFQRGIGSVNIFDVILKENDLVNARNNELNAKVELLVLIAELDQAIGTTIDTWKPAIDASELLQR